MARPLPVAVLLALAAQALFSWRLTVPDKLVFDEVHYVPAARTLLSPAYPTNVEHPLLGKALIAAGMLMFGDNPLGWRALSTVAGTATVLAAYAILWRLFGSVRTAVVGCVLLLLNFTLFVQARIAMLDGFMAAFVMAAVAAMVCGMRGRATAWWTAGSILLGLAAGVKWAAVPYLGYAAAAFLLVRRYDPEAWPGLRAAAALAILGVAGVASYLLTFAPAFFYAHDPLTLGRLLPFQLVMWQQQTQVLAPHTYQSDWWSWPLMLRPIWYLYEPVDGVRRGILLVGNPVVMWGGLVAVAACLATPDRRLRGVAALWLGSFAVWAVIPKSLGFFYYYYLSSLFLPLALAAVLHHHGRGRLRDMDETAVILAGVLFAYFYPILAAMPLDRPDAFRRWAWFAGWV